ncbi:nuclease Le1 [Auriscalpium vulgare]|uniref:Nuclease Le1 n=1 Tax=Auriscalpium vulgare TaxID=40419 RepID=A0ACB8S6W9_9AGAM|nr:nuclease Le1 [Auriscalpium vulgare]
MKGALQLVFAAVLVAAPSGVAAWGALGHETTGYVAMQFIGSKTLSAVQSSLGSTFNFSLGPAATWADTVRSETAFKFSAPFHFIDAEDNPPTSCSVDISRDCGSAGCVISAIQNYTERVQETKLSATQHQQALLFITHFIGDIGQPLHDEALELGGNDIDAICDGSSTNLHAAWDTGMLEKNLDANFSGDPQVYAASLATRITSGDFKSLAAGWVSCIEPSALNSTACPLIWAQEANAFDCTNVFDFKTGQDLCDSAYYTAAIPVIDLQLAKQGYRLAKWLDAIFE